MIRVQKILYPTDFSSPSTLAYFHALGLAEAYKAGLTVLHVHTPGGPDAPDKRAAQAQLESVHPANPSIAVRHALREGDAAAEIVKYAADMGADVIVLGTHGRTGVDRLVLGSVAERVVRDAPCSVLVVKLPKGGAGQPPG